MKLIHSSNLALRFYVSEGWTQEELSKYLLKGSVSIKHPSDLFPYYTLDSGSYFDCKLLLQNSSGVYRTFDDEPKESDLTFLERMNGL